MCFTQIWPPRRNQEEISIYTLLEHTFQSPFFSPSPIVFYPGPTLETFTLPNPKAFLKPQCNDLSSPKDFLSLISASCLFLLCHQPLYLRASPSLQPVLCLSFPTLWTTCIIKDPETSWQFLLQRTVNGDTHPLLNSLLPYIHQSFGCSNTSDSPPPLFPAP